MAVLLDTHAAIWYFLNSKKLPARARKAIERTIGQGGQILISAVTLVETVYLVEAGRVPFEALRKLKEAMAGNASGFEVVPVDAAIAEAVGQIPRTAVPDMPDRIIGATAVHLGIPLVTRDRRLRAASIRTIW
jgi:PIN domain nuclease of toxin-antitoxin system